MQNEEFDFVFNFDDPDYQVDMEHELFIQMIKRAKEDINYAVNNPWGEFKILCNGESNSVQWTYVSLENTDYQEVEHTGKKSYIPVGEWYWDNNDNTPDFEVSCSWKN